MNRTGSLKLLVTMSVIALLTASACSQEARYKMQDGERYRAIVADSTDNSIVFQSAADGSLYQVRRSEVVEIKHPGKTERTAGIVGIVLGSTVALVGGGILLSLATSAPSVEADPMGIVSFGGGALTAIGVSTVIGSTAGFVWGRNAYRRSVDRAKPSYETGHRP